MNARESAVARVLVRAYGRDFDTDDIAKRAVRAADRADTGRRTITTEAELIALPIGSVVLSESYTHYLDGMRIAFQKWNDEAWHRGGRAGTTHPDNFLPATVLHEPEATR